LKIATYNCNGVRARVDSIIEWMKKENPDILCLQEIKVETELFPYDRFEEIGYRSVVQGKKGHAGVATLFRSPVNPPDDIYPGFRDGDETEFSRILTCRWNKFYLINTYVPQGRDREHEQFQYKLEWFARFREMLEDFHKPSRKILWTGDFNVAPEPIDVYNSPGIMGHVAHTPEVFEALENVREWGFVDVFRKLHPDDEGQYTYWDYRFRGFYELNKGWRVDHMYATKSLAKLCSKIWIDRDARGLEKPSDHTFLVGEFQL